jgi:hypothetical protein
MVVASAGRANRKDTSEFIMWCIAPDEQGIAKAWAQSSSSTENQ